MKKYIYADNAATTKLDMDAFEAMKPYLLDEYGNASQPYSFSRTTKKALIEARKIIADCIGAEPEEIFFTSGGSESDNWAIKSVLFADVARKRIVTSAIEHHAILRSCAALEKIGYDIIYLSPTADGIITIDELTKRITKNTYIVSVMLANNEIGTIQSIKELCKVAHDNGSLFHTDAVQAVGHIKIDVKELGVDMLSASAHKFNGPKGVGFLFVKKGTTLPSFVNGGSQEFGHRAGTENVASIVGMAMALSKNCKAINDNIVHIIHLQDRLLQGLKPLNPICNGGEKTLPGLISLSFNGADGETILHRMDLSGICISTGSACNSKKTEISHVLKAIGLHEKLAKGTIRISLCKNNTMEEIDEIVLCLLKILNK